MRTSLVALILALSAPVSAAELTPIGVRDWAFDAANGVSGLELSGDGLQFAAVSDRGWFLEGIVVRDGEAIAEVTVTAVTPLLGHDGFPVAARRTGDWSDAEGLGIADDGTHFVSFERWAHVYRYADPQAAAFHLRDHPSFYDYRDNRQLEALAIAPDGAVIALPESPLDGLRFPVYRHDGTGWEIQSWIDPLDAFSPVGADFADDGKMYLLERKLVLGFWWQSRIRRFQSLEGEGEIIWTSRPGDHFNLEGIAVWRDEQGLRITMVSDNNGDASEPTQFVEYR